ncbi:protein of unknown function [Paenibacillus alvei]|uniref:Uncharacterized protein n=1 Tax=Paenibacillus alvei TaxID=44250 RepID=A0A383RKB9_PAEAL|nr:protein of unknown function [Paenibacillus alvei]
MCKLSVNDYNKRETIRADHYHGFRAVLHDRFFTWVWELVPDGMMEFLLV